MGAHDFTDVGFGKTIGEAYASACEQAEFEHGHDGYNGTISTTNGIVSVDALLRPFSVKRRAIVANAAVGTTPFDPTFDERPKRGDWYRLHAVNGRTYLVPKDLRPNERDVAVRLSTMVEKWGPALGYEVTGTLGTEMKKRAGFAGRRGVKAFRFFGLAAS